MTAEEKYKHGFTPRCRDCEYCKRNHSWYTTDIEYKNPVTKRKNKLRMKKNGCYCLHISMCNEKGKPHKINGNHLKWWGYTPCCPFNLYTHVCEVCGRRMATDKVICSSCKKYRDLNERGIL